MNEDTENAIRTILDIQRDYEDLGNCMCSDDHGARLLALLNANFDKALPSLLKSISNLDKHVPKLKDPISHIQPE